MNPFSTLCPTLRWIACSLCLLFLSQCATQPLPPSTQWTAHGSISIQSDRIHWMGHFHWKKYPHHQTIRLTGPLGIPSILIHATEQTVQLTSPQIGTINDQQCQRLFQKTLGWVFPINQAPYWLMGRPAPQHTYQGQYNPKHQLTELWQGQWHVLFIRKKHRTSPIIIERPPVTIKLVVTDLK